MGKISFDAFDEVAVSNTRKRVEDNSDTLDKVVTDIVDPYCKDLDRYVQFIRDCLKDGEAPPTDEELDDFCLNLSTLIYFAGGMCEQLGIRNDMSKSVYKEAYNSCRSSLTDGTVADKDSIAELQALQEQITNTCYDRAYRIVKAKVENAQELLGSVKKVISRRTAEIELGRMTR